MTRFIWISAACLGLSSCLGETKDNCSATITEPVLSVVGPRTLAVGQSANFLLTYVPQNTCSTLAGFQEQTGNVPNTYGVGVSVRYNDCNCPSNTAAAQATYTFKPAAAGTYYVHFVANTTSGVIVDTLVVR